jgi:hypothetical protein
VSGIDPDLAKGRSSSAKVKTNNRVRMDDGDYAVTIADSFLFYANEKGRFVRTKAEADHQALKLSLTLDDFPSREPIGFEFPVKTHEKSHYARTLKALRGISDDARILAFDPKSLVGDKAFATIECAERTDKETGEVYHYINVRALRPQQARVVRPPDAQQEADAAPPPRRRAAPPAAQPAAAAPPPTDALAKAKGSVPPANPGGPTPTDLQIRWLTRFVEAFAIKPPFVRGLCNQLTRDSEGGEADQFDQLTSDEAFAMCQLVIEHIERLRAMEADSKVQA